METFAADHVTVSWLHAPVGRETLLGRDTPPATQVSLRFSPTPTAQPSPAGSPCDAIPACSPRRSRAGLTHSSSDRLATGTGTVTPPVLESSTPVPAATKGPATPYATSPT